jgi:hypothetical protein
LAEFLDAHELVLELVALFSDGLHHSDALAVTLPCNALHILWVDTQSFGFFFYIVSMALSRLHSQPSFFDFLSVKILNISIGF